MTASAASSPPDSNRRPRTPPFPKISLVTVPSRTEIPDFSICVLEKGGGLRIELAGQEPVEELDDVDLGLAAADGPGDLQAEQSAAEDGDAPVRAEMLDEVLRVGERPQHEDALPVRARDGRDGGPGARRQEQRVVAARGARGRLDRLVLGPDPHDLLAEVEDDPLLLGPAFGESEELLAGHAAGHELDQVGAGIVGARLFREDLDPDVLIELTQGLGGHGARQPAADDDHVHVREGSGPDPSRA